MSITEAIFSGELHVHPNILLIGVFMRFHRLMCCFCWEFVEDDGNNWHLRRQCLPLRLIWAGVNPRPRLTDSPLSALAGLRGVRKSCQCVSQFNSIKRRFKLQIKMQITSVIKASESTGRDKIHPSLLLPALMKYKPLFNVKCNLILKNKVSGNTLSASRFCSTWVMLETKKEWWLQSGHCVSSCFLTTVSELHWQFYELPLADLSLTTFLM